MANGRTRPTARRGRRSRGGILPLKGIQYYNHTAYIPSTAGTAAYIAFLGSDFKLPEARTIKPLRFRVTASATYDSVPYEIRAEGFGPLATEAAVTTRTHMVTPFVKTILQGVYPNSTDTGVYTADSDVIRVWLIPPEGESEAPKVSAKIEFWGLVGPDGAGGGSA